MAQADIRNKHIMIDLGTGNNNKMYVSPRVIDLLMSSNWAMADKQEVSLYSLSIAMKADDQMIDVIETVYRGASKGRGLVVAPKGMLSDFVQVRS